VNPLSERLASAGPLLIDGGTGTELERLGAAMVVNGWCAVAALTHPETVCQVHRSYIEAGAELIIANTFATSRHVLAWAGLEEHFEYLNTAAVELALRARHEAGRPEVVVAASISSTTQGGEFPPIEVARANYADQARIQADAGAELLVLEMMRDIDQTQAALDGALATGLPIWIGYSGIVEHGVPWLVTREMRLEDALAALDTSSVELVAIMHTETDEVDACLDVVDRHWDGPVGVYAHCGVFEPPNWRFIGIITPDDYAAACLRWLDRGVKVIGGCCGIGPEHISHLRAQLST
jgi:methionine synthase I (cobalamin-dependent)